MARDEELYEMEQRIEELERKVHRSRTLPYTVLALMFAVLYSVCIQYKINDHFKNKLRSQSHTVELKVDHAE